MSARLDTAVQAFADVERVELLLDKKRRALSEAVTRLPLGELNDYVQATDQVIREIEAKREKVGL